jgi:hypothetical protein
MTDPLDEIKARWRYGNNRQPGAPLYREQLDVDWLIGALDLARDSNYEFDAVYSHREVERLRGLLARLEWAGTEGICDEDWAACPACGAAESQGRHGPICWLADAIRPTSVTPPEGPQP